MSQHRMQPEPALQKPTSLLGDRTYTFVRQSATIILPAIGALYFALAQIWGLPNADEVVGTVAALNVFAGVLAAMSKTIYDKTGGKYDGTVDVEVTDDGTKRFLLNLDGDPNALGDKSEITFKVNTK